MEKWYNKGLVLGIIVTLIGAVVIPSINGYDNKISIQSSIEESTCFPLNADYVNAYWKFDECDGNILYDSSGNGYDGTIYGATWESYGSGCTLDFDGVDDYVDFDEHAKYYLGFNKSDDLIFSFIFKSSSTDKGIIYSSCRGDAYGYNPGFHIALNSDGTLQVQVWRLNCGILMNTTGTYNDDSWHFAEIFYNGDSGNPIVDVYCDETYDSSYEKYVCAFYSDQFKYTQIGRNSDDFSDYFDGKLDEFKIIKYPGGNLQLPPIIDGLSGGVPNVEYDYTFTIVDPEEDDCEIKVDFNGVETEWNGPYESGEVITMSHKWDYGGTFYIRAKSRDRWGESPWSDPFPVEITENLPPNPPTVSGPLTGKPNTEYDFTLNSVDPNGDDVRFIVDWGDGDSETTSFTTSGSDLIVSHSWSEKGTYTIRVYAEDVHGATSGETTGQMVIKKSKAINNPFLNLLESHPNIFPILQKLLQHLRL
jgi:hypothetical protein